MSHPPGPGNPYSGQPTPPQQPQLPPQQPYAPYGHPPQHPTRPQPSYGFPQQPQQQWGRPQQPQPPYGWAGLPGGPQTMPSSARTARAMLCVLAGMWTLGGLFVLLVGIVLANVDDESGLAAKYGGLLWVAGVLALALAVMAIGVAAKYRTGGSGVRAGSIAMGALSVAGLLASLVTGGFLSVVPLVPSILLIVFASKAETAAWFKRPQY
ncbi:hypothetical protein ACFYXS_24795 [Streptomyces sp. NPDC002574]|uniref:hypothetical protein n=1 Tax=Streptomyces sp. NPDC002574 TaxID=3364652 RepID=UPI00369A6314